MRRRPTLALLLALRRATGERELAARLDALLLWLLWAELAAAAGRNERRPAWMRPAAPARPVRSLHRARRSTSGRRPRG